MKKSIIIIFWALLTLPYLCLGAAVPGRITVNGTQFAVCGNRIWMNGCNTPWQNWDDFGGTYDSAFWGTHFAALNAAGVNASRIWITCSGTVGINIDTAGVVTGGTAAHWSNLDDLFAKAQANGIYVMATLLSFDHFKTTSPKYQNWSNWVNSDSNIDSYINTYLTTFLTRYGNNPALWSIDLCNEPEWASSTESEGTINWTRLQTYFAKAAVAIHKWNNTNGSGPLVTVGMGYIKYNSDTRGLGGENKLADADLAALITTTADKPLAKMDFWSTHYYPWQDVYGGIIFTYTPSSYGLPNDRPAVVGECPNKYGSTNGTTNTSGQLRTDYTNGWNNGWQGFFPWTSNGAGSGDFGDLTNELSAASLQMLTLVPTLVRPSCSAFSPTATPTRTPAYSATITRTHTITPTYTATMAYDIIYDGDTTGHQLSDGTVTNSGSGTMTEVAGTGNPNDGMRLSYVSPGWWQQLQWDLTVNKDIGANNYLTFDIKSTSATVTLLSMRINWTITVNVLSYLVEGGSIDTTWKTVRIPISALIESGQTVIDFLLFISTANTDYTVIVDNIRLEGAAPTATLTHVSSSTYTRTATPTLTRTATPSGTFTASPTFTRTGTPTLTRTLSSTLTHTPSRTATPTGTFTAVNTVTRTATASATPTFTYTMTATATASPNHTVTQTFTPQNTGSPTFTPTSTLTSTQRPTRTATTTATRTFTAGDTATPSFTPTSTSTMTHTLTYTLTATLTHTNTSTPTRTTTQTHTISPTFTCTPTGTPPTVTFTGTFTATATSTPTATVTATPTFTYTVVETDTFTATATRTRTPDNTYTATADETGTFTATATRTATATNTAPTTYTATRTNTPTNTATRSATPTFTRTPTPTTTRTSTLTFTMTFTSTSTVTIIPDTETFTPTITVTPTNTPSPVATAAELAITETRPFPNPYNGTVPFNVSYTTNRNTTYATLLIYSASYRLVLKYTDTTDKGAGPCVTQVPAAKLAKFGSGTYYGVIEAKADNGNIARSAVVVVLIKR